MKQVKAVRQARAHHDDNPIERREAPRILTSFRLMYSGLDENEVLMGDGTVVNLSKGGLGIRGNHHVKPGLDLTLFLYLPDGDDPLFILEAHVAWTNGRQFGVELKKLSLREGHRLHTFLFDQQHQ